jgi:hypothetical protein
MFFAEWRLQLRIVILPRSVVLLDAKNTWHDRQSPLLALLLPDFATCRADWMLIFHAP